MKNMNQWGLIFRQGQLCIMGKLDSGDIIKTSPIVSVEKATATTESGSKYQLGELHPQFVRFVLSFANDEQRNEYNVADICGDEGGMAVIFNALLDMAIEHMKNESNA